MQHRHVAAAALIAAAGLVGGLLALGGGGPARTEVISSAGAGAGSDAAGKLSFVGYKDGKPAPGTTKPPGTPTATHFAGMPTVGALYHSGQATKHTCTASVIDSPGGNVILTAAHCVRGSGAGMVFVPAYDDGKEPYGAWSVIGSRGAPSWLHGLNRQRDFAFLTVASRSIGGKVDNIQSVTGGLQLGNGPLDKQWVTVPAYPSGTDDQPIRCTARVYFDDGYPAFNCNPYPAGTSGGPWLSDTRHGEVIVGIIGGLHQGGCYTYTSYSSDFGVGTWDAYVAASVGERTSSFPGPGSDGCRG